MILNNFRRYYHSMIKNKSIIVPDIDSMITRHKKKKYVKYCMLLSSCVFLLFINLLGNNFGYHEFLFMEDNSGFYGGRDIETLGVHDNNFYYLSKVYDQKGVFKINLIQSDLDNNKQLLVKEFIADQGIMINNLFICKEHETGSYTIYDLHDLSLNRVSLKIKIDRLILINENIIGIKHLNTQTLIFLFDENMKVLNEYSLDIGFDEVFYLNDEKVLGISSGQIYWYDLRDNKVKLFDIEMNSMKDFVFYDDSMMYLDKDGNLYYLNIHTKQSKLIASSFKNAHLKMMVISNEKVVYVLHELGRDNLYLLDKNNEPYLFDTIENDQVWKIFVYDRYYLLQLDEGYYLNYFKG